MITQAALYPPEPATTRGSSTFVSYDKNSDRIAYACGSSIFVRSLDPESKLSPLHFTKHTVTATAAAFSPSGNYIASGDESGNVKIWETCIRDDELYLKSEFQALGGVVKSLVWDADNSRIIAVGDGKEKFGHCFMWDSGNSIGEIQGHSETINAVDIKPQRPYRAATVGDDKSMVFFTGPPFKFDKSSRNHHTNSVRAVKFSPDGKWLVTVGSDRLIVLYDGKTGEYVKKKENAHEGGIFSVCWFEDSSFFVTASADGSLKKWNAESLQEELKYVVSPVSSVDDQQVSVVVTKNFVVSLSLNGHFNQFSHDSPELVNVIYGHQRPLTTVGADNGTLITGASDGSLFTWKIQGDGLSSVCKPFTTEDRAHSNYISSVNSYQGSIVTTGWDDELKLWENGKLKTSIHLPSQPKGLVIAQNVVVLLESKIQVYDGALSFLAEEDLKYTASSISATAESSVVFVTNETDKRAEQYDTLGGIKHLVSYPTLRAAPSLVRVSPDGQLLAVAETNGKYTLYSTKDQSVITTRWAFHNSRINDAAWTSDSKYLISGGLDCWLFVYSVARPAKVLKYPQAHKIGVSGLKWLTFEGANGSVASTGLDATVRTWNVDLSAY